MGHVLARLAGFGVHLVPVWPYAVTRSAGQPDSVVVTHWAGETAQTATVTVTADGPRPSIVSTGGEPVDEIVDVSDGLAERVWRIETSLYRVEWPAAFEISSPPADDPSPFHLWGPDEALIYPQGPVSREQIPQLDVLAGPGQAILELRSGPGLEAIDLAYQHDGVDWRQSHYVVPFGNERVLVITAQSPASHVKLTLHAAETVARSVTPRT